MKKRGRTRMDDLNKVVTIEDVARDAGVGKGTVDRVLHSRGRVAPETREKVLQAIDKLNYKPNIVARMLAKKRSYRIAVCYHDKEKEFWDQVSAGIRRASEEYEQMGVKVIPFVLPCIDVEMQLAVIRQVIDEHYDGLAIVPYLSQEITDALNEAVARGVEVVTFNSREAGVHACYVGIDGIQSGRTAGRMMSMIAPPGSRYMIVSSHSRLMMQIDERALGFQEVLRARRPDMQYINLDTAEEYTFEEDYDQVYEYVLRTLQKCPVDAIYATNECVSAVGRAIDDLKPDHKVNVVGHDLTPSVMNYIRKGVIDASIGQEPERQGFSSVDKICRKLLTGEEIRDEYTRISIVVSENMDYL